MVISGFFRGESFDPDEDIQDLDGQTYTVYIVTGAGIGIGYGIAVHLLQHNASKIMILNNSEEHAPKAMADLKQSGDTSRLICQQCNLRNLQQTDEVAKKLRKEHRIDGLILNAGIRRIGLSVVCEQIKERRREANVSVVGRALGEWITMLAITTLVHSFCKRASFMNHDTMHALFDVNADA